MTPTPWPRQGIVDPFWHRTVYMPNGCLEWSGARDRGGYGVLNVDGRRVRAHRHALELTLGRLVPPELDACHHCDNPPCCRPDHLFEGTRADNLHDAINKGRFVFVAPRPGVLNPKAKLDEDLVRAIRAAYAGGGIRQVDLAAEYGVTQGVVSKIVRYGPRSDAWTPNAGSVRAVNTGERPPVTETPARAGCTCEVPTGFGAERRHVASNPRCALNRPSYERSPAFVVEELAQIRLLLQTAGLGHLAPAAGVREMLARDDAACRHIADLRELLAVWQGMSTPARMTLDELEDRHRAEIRAENAVARACPPESSWLLTDPPVRRRRPRWRARGRHRA